MQERGEMLLGYNTNGLAHHDPDAALELLAEIGYRSVAITIDHGWLHPYRANLDQEIAEMRRRLRRFGLRSVIETGARFLLNPREKHEPTLVSADPSERTRRIDFLRRAIDIAAALQSDCVSLWAGVVKDDAPHDVAFSRVVNGLQTVLQHASLRRMAIGFEPEPGMLIDTMTRFDELATQIQSPQFRLTLDVGHLHCLGETPIADYVQRYADQLVNVHLEDMRAGVHEHLMFGEGEMNFVPIIDAFRRVGYEGGLHVELSRHSHAAPTAAADAFRFLNSL